MMKDTDKMFIYFSQLMDKELVDILNNIPSDDATDFLLYRKLNQCSSDTTIGGIGGLWAIPQGVTEGRIAPMDKIVRECKRTPILEKLPKYKVIRILNL